MLVPPFLGVFNKAFPAQVMLIFSIFAELLLHLGLGGNACVVCAWQPQCGMPLLSGPPRKNILDGVIQNMAHREHAGYIRGRDYN